MSVFAFTWLGVFAKTWYIWIIKKIRFIRNMHVTNTYDENKLMLNRISYTSLKTLWHTWFILFLNSFHKLVDMDFFLPHFTMSQICIDSVWNIHISIWWNFNFCKYNKCLLTKWHSRTLINEISPMYYPYVLSLCIYPYFC